MKNLDKKELQNLNGGWWSANKGNSASYQIGQGKSPYDGNPDYTVVYHKD